MLTMRSNNGLSREHDRQVRLHSVRTDLELDMPPRIHLPDGEEYPYGSMAKLHLRNSEQVRVYNINVKHVFNIVLDGDEEKYVHHRYQYSMQIVIIIECN